MHEPGKPLASVLYMVCPTAAALRNERRSGASPLEKVWGVVEADLQLRRTVELINDKKRKRERFRSASLLFPVLA